MIGNNNRARFTAPLGIALLILKMSTAISALEVDALHSLSDEFESGKLSNNWQPINSRMGEFESRDGELHFGLTMKTVWFHGRSGPALVKNVKGNFAVSAKVRVRRESNKLLPPAPVYQFAGLIARDANSEDMALENWVFTALGERGGYYTNETKDTRNNMSIVHGPDTNRIHADGELRMCRIGQVFSMYGRSIGETAWVHIQSYDRGERPMPSTLQVGPIAYAYNDTHDVVGVFDWIRFHKINFKTDCLI